MACSGPPGGASPSPWLRLTARSVAGPVWGGTGTGLPSPHRPLSLRSRATPAGVSGGISVPGGVPKSKAQGFYTAWDQVGSP